MRESQILLAIDIWNLARCCATAAFIGHQCVWGQAAAVIHGSNMSCTNMYRCPWDTCTSFPGTSVQMSLGNLYMSMQTTNNYMYMSLGYLYKCPWDICTDVPGTYVHATIPAPVVLVSSMSCSSMYKFRCPWDICTDVPGTSVH